MISIISSLDTPKQFIGLWHILMYLGMLDFRDNLSFSHVFCIIYDAEGQEEKRY